MKRAGETQSTAKTTVKPAARGRRVLIRVAVWTLAVPALCAAVLVGGAAPLYLLLPDVKPVSQGVVAPALTSAPTSPQPGSAARSAMVEPAEAAVLAPSEAVDELTTGATRADAAPDEDVEDDPAEAIAAATVVPTPRPAVSMPPQAEETRDVAALQVVPPRRDSAPPQSPRSEATLKGRRMNVRTAAKLRDAPQGAEIGVLREGTALVVGRCDQWCEVSVDGRRGFVHASLIGGSAERPAERRIGARTARARPADERPYYGRPDPYDGRRYARPLYENRDAERRDDDRRFYERAYRRGEDPDWLQDDPDRARAEPDWYIEDERPIARVGRPARLYYEPYP